MFRFKPQEMFVVALFAAGILVAGCANPEHQMASDKSGVKIACQKCYDAVVAERQQAPRSDTQFDVTVRKHMCPDCKNEVSVYRQGGMLKIKCAKCAPEGVPCDKCLPPDAPESSRQKVRRSLRGDQLPPDAPVK